MELKNLAFDCVQQCKKILKRSNNFLEKYSTEKCLSFRQYPEKENSCEKNEKKSCFDKVALQPHFSEVCFFFYQK